MTTTVTTLLWISALGSGLMAGVYFAFSGFIIRAFGSLEPGQAIAAMNAINSTILRSLFVPLFFGSSIVAALLVAGAALNRDAAGSGWMLLAGALYLLGMFVCTAAFNVPLNNALAQTEPGSAAARDLWFQYLKTWTRWNHLRTLCSLATCGLCIWLLAGA